MVAREDGKLDQALRNQERIEAKLDRINGSVTAIMMELGGVPDPKFRDPERKTVRSRLHTLENERAVEKAIRNSYDRAWSRSQKVALFLLGAGAFIVGLLGLLGVGR